VSEEKNAFFLAFCPSVSDALSSSDEEGVLSDSDSFSSCEFASSDSLPVSSDVANGSSPLWSSSSSSYSRTETFSSVGSSSLSDPEVSSPSLLSPELSLPSWCLRFRVPLWVVRLAIISSTDIGS
jgi:hypothetical protein